MEFTGKDVTIMKLMHYFITQCNYNPILLHGIDNEIWLENLESPYKVIRIVNHYIHNNEQLNFDNFKLYQVIEKLKKKTFSRNMKVLNIYVDLGDNVELISNTNLENVSINKISDLKVKKITDVFPDIINKTKFEEKGMALFARITNDINTHNKEKTNEVEKVFKKRKPIVTYSIIAICIIIFALMYIIGNGSEDSITLLKFGANFDLLTKNGQYYRLITCAFLHIGFFHLFFNMYALYIIGAQIENFYKKTKFIIIYLVSAASASILSLSFSTNTISAGASGAIFGLLGAMLYFGYHYRVYLGNVIKSQILPIILINLMIGFTFEGIDNAAHIGGLLGGLFSSIALGVNGKSKKSDKINGLILLTIYLIFIIYLAFFR